MTGDKEYLEIEAKYSAEGIDRIAFKDLVRSLSPTSFIYVESNDVYYIKSENEFLRYRMPSENKLSGEETRQELTFKKKHSDKNNWSRTEVNLRVDNNDPSLIDAFCKGLGYNNAKFTISKACDIYFWPDADVVYYSVRDEKGKYQYFIEVEALEDCGTTKEQAWEVVLKYEKLLAPLGITPQKRKKLSLFEMYSNYEKKD